MVGKIVKGDPLKEFNGYRVSQWLSSGLFLKFMYSISVSKYEVTVYLLVFTHLQFAFVKLLNNQTVRLIWLVQNQYECLPRDCSLTLLRFFIGNLDEISCICKIIGDSLYVVGWGYGTPQPVVTVSRPVMVTLDAFILNLTLHLCRL